MKRTLIFVVLFVITCNFFGLGLEKASAGILWTPPPRVYTKDDKTKKGKPFPPSILSILVVNNDKELWRVYEGERLVAEVAPGARRLLYVWPRNEETSPKVVLTAQKASGGQNVLGRFQFYIPGAYETYYVGAGGSKTETQQRVWMLPPPPGSGNTYGW